MPVAAPGKIEYLEGLRGIAALQVVLLHFVTGFLPWAAEHAWPPLRLLFDGHTAVYVFFLISGAVLTPSFARPGRFVVKCVRRVVRLGLPVAAASVVALVLLLLLPDAHVRAAALTGSAWLAMDSSGAMTLGHLLREIGLDSVLLGYREATLFAPWADSLPPMAQSLDAPFWSLHIELYGSLLVLGLVTLRTHAAWLYRAAVLVAAVGFGTHPMFLFVVGHLSALMLHPHPDLPPLRGTGGVLLLLLGAALCATKDWGSVEQLRVWLCQTEFASAPNLFQFQSQLGAVALYFGVLLCPAIWSLLASRPLRRLGRLSFSIYLLHFPILFTLVCAAFIRLRPVTPYPIAAAFVLFLACTVAAAIPFERWVDRSAIALSRLRLIIGANGAPFPRPRSDRG
jgi:peptidoglycan/LPS O-acetylase OafA/YrhL